MITSTESTPSQSPLSTRALDESRGGMMAVDAGRADDGNRTESVGVGSTLPASSAPLVSIDGSRCRLSPSKKTGKVDEAEPSS
jgi:hypothetical protein